AQGCAHVLSYPHVLVSGDAAVATNYSRVYVLRDGEWHVARAAANRWELARGPDGAWRVERRVNRLMSGSAESRALLAQGLDPSG
ncbi:MAG TPA: nuclear transport factor 2 family protein, partial [Novosphingobium sp.]